MPDKAFNGWHPDPETFLAALRPWGLKQTGKDEYRARCPAHDGGDPNLAIRRDGDKVLTHCHSHGCTFDAIQRTLGLERDPPRAGDSQREPDDRFVYRDRRLPGDRFRPNPVARDESAIANRIRFAINIWCASKPAMGTPVEAYLHWRL